MRRRFYLPLIISVFVLMIGYASLNASLDVRADRRYKELIKKGCEVSVILGFNTADEVFYKEEFEKINIKKYDNKLYLLVGDVEYENQFVSLTKYTYNRLLEMGMKKDRIKYVHDLEGIHHETFWNKYFNDAIKHWEK